ncbi:MAG: VanZ family protein [Bacteroidales bacterium]|nr:VanZ family protein [Bacteroidales bacterium]
MVEKIYRGIFWTGYLAVLIFAFIPVSGSLNRIKVGPEAFKFRMDHILHFTAYFLICMYYLAGRLKGFTLFGKDSPGKFFLITLFLAVSTEVVQIWVPVRSFNVFDAVANVAGLFFGAVIIKAVLKRRIKAEGGGL